MPGWSVRLRQRPVHCLSGRSNLSSRKSIGSCVYIPVVSRRQLRVGRLVHPLPRRHLPRGLRGISRGRMHQVRVGQVRGVGGADHRHMPVVPAGHVRVGSGVERLHRLPNWDHRCIHWSNPVHQLRCGEVPREYWRIVGHTLCLMLWSNLLSRWSRRMHRLWCWKLQEFRVRGLHMHHLPRWNHFFKWFSIRLRQLCSWEVPCDYWRIVGHTLCVMHWSNLCSLIWSRRMHRLWCWKLQEFRVRGLHMHHLPRWNHFFKWFSIRLRQLRSWKVPCDYWRIVGHTLCVMHWSNLCSLIWSRRMHRLWCWKLQEFGFSGLGMHHLPSWNHFFKWFSIRLRQLRSWKVPCDYWRIGCISLWILLGSILLSGGGLRVPALS